MRASECKGLPGPEVTKPATANCSECNPLPIVPGDELSPEAVYILLSVHDLRRLIWICARAVRSGSYLARSQRLGAGQGLQCLPPSGGRSRCSVVGHRHHGGGNPALRLADTGRHTEYPAGLLYL